MRLSLLGWAAAVALVVLANPGQAQAQFGGVTSDPFSFYYGYYLPHQQAMANQPRPLDTINQIVARRQYSAQTDRSSLYDPISPYAAEEDEPFAGRGEGRGGQRGGGGGGAGRGSSFTYGGDDPGNIRGNGPSLYYKRTARYFPTLREGRGQNMNLSALRGSRNSNFGGGMGGMGVPSVGVPGVPGPR